MADERGFSGYSHEEDDDLRGAAHVASRHAGQSGSVELFSSILDTIGQKKKHNEIDQDDINEAAAVKNHKKYFAGDDEDGDADERGMGSAAVVQALKMFTGGNGPAGGGAGVSGTSQSEFVGLAMGEASKLFDKKASQGKAPEGASKESALMQAGEMALKFYMKSKADAPAAGPGGGASGLMGLASQFMK